MSQFVHIAPGDIWGPNQERKDVALAKKTWACRSCMLVKRGVEGVDIRLDSVLDIAKPLNFVWESVGLVWRELLAPVSAKVLRRDLYFGRVYNDTGTEYEGWSTFHGRYR